ncbi:MAG TPA: DNA glycosylase [Nitrososphaera sp.]|nr:DNA glycosylase [Nitrososphaera sp.]
MLSRESSIRIVIWDWLTDLQSLDQSFDPITTINSGQVFLWEKRTNSCWYGVSGDHVVKIRQTASGQFEFSSFPEDKTWYRSMFRLDDDVRTIFREISRDSLVRQLVRLYRGLRLMRQEPHQCIFSFVCASNTNIPMIHRMLHNLTRKFGRPRKIDGIEIFTFPSPRDIDKAEIGELRACGLGYRAKAVKAAAHAITSGQLDFEALKAATYEEAKKELMQIYGIGNKIADCILLFSLEKLDAFPIDIWIARALSHNYSWLHQKKFGDKLTLCQYEEVSIRARRYFGRYAGYAQQYLYYHMRQTAGRAW